MRGAILQWIALAAIIITALLIYRASTIPVARPAVGSQSITTAQPTVIALQQTQIALDSTIAANTMPEPSRTPKPTNTPRPTKIPPTALPIGCEFAKSWELCSLNPTPIPTLTPTPGFEIADCPTGKVNSYPYICFQRPIGVGESE